MATITKVKLKSGVRWKALCRRGNRSKSKTFRLKSNAKAWAEEIERGDERSKSLWPDCPIMTLGELAEEYLDQYEGRDHTRESRVKFWVARLGNTLLIDVKPNLVKMHLDEYQAGTALSYGGIKNFKPTTRKLDKTRSPASRNRMKACLAAMLNYAREHEYIHGRSATSDIRVVPENNKRRRFLTESERKRLLLACRRSEYDKLYLLVIIALTSGCRLGELINLRWSDIDFTSGDEHIHLERTKNGDPRRVPLAKPAIDELNKFRDVGGALVFPGKRKKHRPFVGFRKYWARAKKEAGVTDFRFNDTRHDVGSKLAMEGRTLVEIGDVLGHKSEQTTKRYAHLSTKHKKDIVSSSFDDYGD